MVWKLIQNLLHGQSIVKLAFGGCRHFAGPNWPKRGIFWHAMPACSDLQQLKDCCLIIVGDGEDADAVLAKRRLEAGGRLCHILTRGIGDPRVKVQKFSNDGRFYWQPPAFCKISPFGKRLGGTMSQAWTKTGPDGIVLPDDHKLVVANIDDSLQRVHMFNGEGEVVMEMTGWVVLCPTMHIATTASVEVQDMHMKAMGTFSGRRISVGCVVSFAMLLTHFLLIIFAERSLQSQAPVAKYIFFIPSSMAISGVPMVKVLAFALCGDDLTWRQAWSVCLLGVVAGIPGAISTGMALSEAMWAFVAYTVWCIGLFWVYYSGRHRHTLRKFWPRLAWLTCVFLGTAGGLALIATSILIYASMVASNQTILAAIFLPSVTAGAEIGLVKMIEVAHCRLVCMRPSEDMTSGDQLFLVVPVTVIAVHACCEAARLMAMFIVTVADGGYSWVGSAVATFLFNLLMRSGWTSFLMFRLCKLFCGRRFAAQRFAPSGFNKLHNHSKVFGGYLRFIPIASLVTARALTYGLDVADLHPAFNISAAIAVLVLLGLEILEDVVILNEVIPPCPMPEDFLREVSGNTDPHQLFVAELRPCVSVQPCSVRSVVPTPDAELMEWRPALKRTTAGWGQSWRCGQDQALHCGLALHGLREIPLTFQVAIAWIACAAVCFPLFPAMLGAGYMLGLNDPCPVSEVWIQYFWQESPRRCWSLRHAYQWPKIFHTSIWCAFNFYITAPQLSGAAR